MLKSLVGRVVKRAQFHVGFGDTSRTGCHADKDEAYMEVTQAGIYIAKKDDREFLVPYSNVTWAELVPEKKPAALKAGSVVL